MSGNSLVNVNAFLCVARHGSFTAAARELGVVTSVVTRRIDQFEDLLGTRLLVRSTRGLKLTAAVEALLPRVSRMAAEFEEILRGQAPGTEGALRVKAPTTVTTEFLGGLFTEFLQLHPRVTLDITLADFSINPLEQGYDIAFGALPISFPHVIDVPLCRHDMVTCCAPAYLVGRRAPLHPRDLVEHECITTRLFTGGWLFDGPNGVIDVEVHSRIHVGDGRVLREAARRGLGIAALACYLVEEDLRSGRLVPLLEEFPLSTHWLKAMVPRIRIDRPAVRALIEFLKLRLRDGPAAEPEVPTVQSSASRSS